MTDKVKLPRGVSRNGAKGFKAQARRNNEVYYLGSFRTAEEAGAKYEEFAAINPMPTPKSIRWDGGTI